MNKKKSCLHCLQLNSAFRMRKKNDRWQKKYVIIKKTGIYHIKKRQA